MSKLKTIPNGLRESRSKLQLLAFKHPMAVFGRLSATAIVVAVAIFFPLLREYLQTGLAPRLATLVSSVTLGLVGLLSVFAGLILSGPARKARDMKRLAYLSFEETAARSKRD